MLSKNEIESIITNYISQDKKITVMALGEFAGFPNPVNGKITTYLDELKKNLISFESINLYQTLNSFQFYDFQSLFFQKSYFIESLLKQNPTVEEVYRLLYNSVGAAKEQSLIANFAIRDAFKNRYIMNRYTMQEENKSIHDIFQTQLGTVVLRSTLSNDISYKIQENVISVLGHKGRKHAVKVIQERKEQIIDEIVDDIVRGYHYIYKLNPSACILEIGIKLPKLFQMKNGNKDMYIINDFLNDIISEVKYCAMKEGVTYISNNTVENNSLSNGQEKLGYEILGAVAEALQNQKMHLEQKEELNFENQGLLGMMQQEAILQKEYAKSFIETHSEADFNRMVEHGIACNCYQKTIVKK